MNTIRRLIVKCQHIIHVAEHAATVFVAFGVVGGIHAIEVLASGALIGILSITIIANLIGEEIG